MVSETLDDPSKAVNDHDAPEHLTERESPCSKAYERAAFESA